MIFHLKRSVSYTKIFLQSLGFSKWISSVFLISITDVKTVKKEGKVFFQKFGLNV